MLLSFILAWGEAWFFDFRMIPLESKAKEIWGAAPQVDLACTLYSDRSRADFLVFPESAAKRAYVQESGALCTICGIRWLLAANFGGFRLISWPMTMHSEEQVLGGLRHAWAVRGGGGFGRIWARTSAAGFPRMPGYECCM